MKKFFKILIIIILISGAIMFVKFFFLRKKFNQPKSQTQINISQPQNEIAAPETKVESSSDLSPVPAPASDPTPPPAKFLLPIPFYSQAPLSKWDAFHEEMCEEASVLNAGLYLENKKPTKDQFETDLQGMQKIETSDIGAWKSTTIAETKKLVDIYFAGKFQSKTIDNPTIIDIETEIAAGHPVVVPLAGREIGNPNFTPPGPVYHMLVLKGYDSQNFIANDVGTRRGDSYTYAKEVIMQNMHDWNAKDIHLGARRILVFYK